MVKVLLQNTTTELKAALVNIIVEFMSAEDCAVFKGTVQQKDDDMVEVLLQYAATEQKAALVNVKVELMSAEYCAVCVVRQQLIDLIKSKIFNLLNF
jgi:hypothetical protein